MRLIILFILINILSLLPAHAYTPFADNQEFYLKHLRTNVYSIDSQASAVVLYDWGEYGMSDITASGMSYRTKFRRVIKIISEDGLKEADISIPYYAAANARPAKVVAKTYSLQGDVVKVTELDQNAVTVDVINNYYKLLKFSFPSVAPGVVIDYSFEIEQAPLLCFVDWRFQDELPVLHSEVSATYLDRLRLSVITKSQYPFQVIDNKELLTMPEEKVPLAYQLPSTSFSGRNTLRYVRRNIRAIVDEDYNYCYENYTDKLDMYLIEFPGAAHGFMSPWRGVNTTFKGEFGSFVNSGSARAASSKMLERALNRKHDNLLDSAKAINSYVRSYFNVTKKGLYDLEKSDFARVVQEQKGTSLEINLVLYKLLTESGIKANMVILSTRNMPRLIKDFPVMDNMNYAVCRVEIGGESYYLDASEKYAAFGVMNPMCYNGYAWLVSDTGHAVDISPDFIKEKSSSVVITESASKDDYRLMVMQNFGRVSAMELRKDWVKDSVKIKSYLKKSLKQFSFDSELLSFNVTGLEDVDEPLKLMYRLKVNFPEADNIFLVPSMFNFYGDNPFKANKRYLPVELPYAVDCYFSLVLKLPVEYKVDEVPSSISCKMDDRNSYKYVAQYDELANTISVSTKLSLSTTFYEAVNYSSLQSFFNTMITQQGEAALIVKRPE